MGAYYAVYQSGAELLGVGLTIADALQAAERWSDRALPSLTSYGLDGPRGETRGAYYLRPWKMFHMCWALSDGSSKLIPIDEQPNHQIVHLFRLGKTNRAAH